MLKKRAYITLKLPISAKIKIQEAWNKYRDPDYPIYLMKEKRTENEEQQLNKKGIKRRMKNSTSRGKL